MLRAVHLPLALAASTVSLAVAGCAFDAERSNLGGPMAVAESDDAVEQAQYRGSLDGRTVVAESRYGHGTVTGTVRRNAQGRLEVRAPGGTWFECGRSCTDTLRRETVDFWESRGARNGPIDGPGYFRWGR